MELDWTIGLAAVAAGAAMLGSMLGLGGGVFLVPIFTLFFGVSQKDAIGASAVAVVANSIVGSQSHLRSGFTNIRLGMMLQTIMAAGALVGATVAVYAPDRLLQVIFGLVLFYAATMMILRRQIRIEKPVLSDDKWHVRGAYFDPAIKTMIEYQPEKLKGGLGISGMAGMLSGMLGVGGGVIQVPAMNLLMKVPVKAAAGTSTFMVGITAVSTAFVFYSKGYIDPRVVVPAVVGIFLGGKLGAELTRRVKTQRLVLIFVVVLFYLGSRLLLQAAKLEVPFL